MWSQATGAVATAAALVTRARAQHLAPLPGIRELSLIAVPSWTGGQEMSGNRAKVLQLRHAAGSDSAVSWRQPPVVF